MESLIPANILFSVNSVTSVAACSTGIGERPSGQIGLSCLCAFSEPQRAQRTQRTAFRRLRRLVFPFRRIGVNRCPSVASCRSAGALLFRGLLAAALACRALGGRMPPFPLVSKDTECSIPKSNRISKAPARGAGRGSRASRRVAARRNRGCPRPPLPRLCRGRRPSSWTRRPGRSSALVKWLDMRHRGRLSPLCNRRRGAAA
jgi:hypothetical protein